MLKQFVACAPGNFLKGRRNHRPEAIVLHAMSSMARARELFLDPRALLSIHYVVSADGPVIQYVEESDSAFHAGIVINPTWRGIRPGVNPNFHTLGVAAVGEWNDALAGRVAALVIELAQRWNITLDADHLPTHAEIRASKGCPGAGFDRPRLLRSIAAQMAEGARAGGAFFRPRIVHMRATGNLREGLPSSTARIVRTLSAGDDVEVVSFTDQGERVRGNSIWYQTAHNNFFWAGNTDTPQPAGDAVVVVPPPAPAPATGGASGIRVASGIARIDALLAGGSAPAIDARTDDRLAVGAIQDLLTGHGYRGLPGILSPHYGSFGRITSASLDAFQRAQQLQVAPAVQAETLSKLIATPAVDPRITQIYLCLVLEIPFLGMHKVLAITAQMEGVGKFGALNLNTDRAGLSFGLIQWAQRPGRLPELLRAFRQADALAFAEIFGEGDEALADALIRHVSRPNGGVVYTSGHSVDPRFDLVADPWVGRFRRAALHRKFQLVQIDVAVEAFNRSYRNLRAYAAEIRSERGAAFMLDVANQFGDGGLRRLYQNVQRPGMSEPDLLEAVADESVDAMPDHFQAGVRARREGFLRTALLSDQAVDLLRA